MVVVEELASTLLPAVTGMAEDYPTRTPKYPIRLFDVHVTSQHHRSQELTEPIQET